MLNRFQNIVKKKISFSILAEMLGINGIFFKQKLKKEGYVSQFYVSGWLQGLKKQKLHTQNKIEFGEVSKNG